MVDRMPWDITAAGADGEKAAPAARPRPGRHLIAVMLLTAAVLDLTRCGLVLAAARHPAPTAGLAAAGLAAAVLSVRTARGCQADRRWAGLAALLIGAASAPQAAMSGFHGPYTIPDTATAVVGVLLAVAVLATAGAAGQPGHDEPQMPLTGDQHPVQAVAVDPADPALGDRVSHPDACTGVRTVRTPTAVSTASRAAVNLVARSRIRNLLRHEVACGE